MSRPLDLLYVRSIFRPADFGGNRYPWEVTRRLAARGHRIRVVTPLPQGPLPGYTGAELVYYPVSRRTPLETFFTNALFSRVAVERSLRARRADVLVLSSYDVALGNLLWSRRKALPSAFIYHSRFRSDFVERLRSARPPYALVGKGLQRFVRWVELVTFRSVDALVAVSPYSKFEIECLAGADGRVRVIPTGVDTEFFQPGDRETARLALGLRHDDRVLLVVGRLAPVKCYDRAIRALAELRNDDSRYVLLVVGRGPEETKLRRLADELGLNDAVRFEGFLEGTALRLRYQAADAQLCTSEFENWSLSLLEGLSCGVPVLGVPRGGIPELLRLVSDELVANGTAPSEVAAIVRQRLRQADELRRLGRRGREVVVARFDWERIVEELERCFGDLARATAARDEKA